MQAADVQRAREQAKQQGKNLLGQIGAQLSTGSGEKYLDMSPELIMNETPQNFAIPLEEVTRINTYHADFEDNSPDMMEVITLSKKWKFQISNYYKVQQQLKEVLGTKVR
jgi:predicted component of type VI protein secretion system